MGTGTCAFLLHLVFFVTAARALCGSEEFNTRECFDPDCTFEKVLDKELGGKLISPQDTTYCMLKENAKDVIDATEKSLQTLPEKKREKIGKILQPIRRLIHKSFLVLELEERIIHLLRRSGETFHLVEQLPKGSLSVLLSYSRVLDARLTSAVAKLDRHRHIEELETPLKAQINLLVLLKQSIRFSKKILGDMRPPVLTTTDAPSTNGNVRTSKVELSSPVSGKKCWLICELPGTTTTTKHGPTQGTSVNPTTRVHGKTSHGTVHSKTTKKLKTPTTENLNTETGTTTKPDVCCKCPPNVPFECCQCSHSTTTTPKSAKSSKTPIPGHPTKHTTNTKSSSKTNASTKSSKTHTPTTSGRVTTPKHGVCCKCPPGVPFECCPCPHSQTTTPKSVKSSKTPISGHPTKYTPNTKSSSKTKASTKSPKSDHSSRTTLTTKRHSTPSGHHDHTAPSGKTKSTTTPPETRTPTTSGQVTTGKPVVCCKCPPGVPFECCPCPHSQTTTPKSVKSNKTPISGHPTKYTPNTKSSSRTNASTKSSKTRTPTTSGRVTTPKHGVCCKCPPGVPFECCPCPHSPTTTPKSVKSSKTRISGHPTKHTTNTKSSSKTNVSTKSSKTHTPTTSGRVTTPKHGVCCKCPPGVPFECCPCPHSQTTTPKSVKSSKTPISGHPTKSTPNTKSSSKTNASTKSSKTRTPTTSGRVTTPKHGVCCKCPPGVPFECCPCPHSQTTTPKSVKSSKTPISGHPTKYTPNTKSSSKTNASTKSSKTRTPTTSGRVTTPKHGVCCKCPPGVPFECCPCPHSQTTTPKSVKSSKTPISGHPTKHTTNTKSSSKTKASTKSPKSDHSSRTTLTTKRHSTPSGHHNHTAPSGKTKSTTTPPETRTPTTSGRVTTGKPVVCCKCPPGVPFECCPCPHSQTTTPKSAKSSKTPISGHPTKHTTNTKSSSKTNASTKSPKSDHSSRTTLTTKLHSTPSGHHNHTAPSGKPKSTTTSPKTRSPTTSGRVTTPKHGVCCKCPPGVPFECCPCPHSQTTTPKSVKSSKTPHSGHYTKHTTNTKSSSKTNASTKSSKTPTPTTSGRVSTPKHGVCCKCPPGVPFECCPCSHSQTTTPKSVKSSKTPHSDHYTKHTTNTKSSSKTKASTKSPKSDHSSRTTLTTKLHSTPSGHHNHTAPSGKTKSTTKPPNTRTPTTSGRVTTPKHGVCCKCPPGVPFECCPCPHSQTTTPKSVKSSKTPISGHYTKHTTNTKSSSKTNVSTKSSKTRTPPTSGRVTTPKHGVCCKCPPGVPFECCPCSHSQTTTPKSIKSSKTPISGHPTKYTPNTKSSSKTNVSTKSSKTRTLTTSGRVTTPKHGVCCKCPPGVPFECCPCPHSPTTTPKSVKSSKTPHSGHYTKHSTSTKSSSKTNASIKSSKTRTPTTSGGVTTPKHGVCCKCPPGVPFECCPCPHSQTTTPKSVKSSKTPHSGHYTKHTTNTKSSSKTKTSIKSRKSDHSSRTTLTTKLHSTPSGHHNHTAPAGKTKSTTTPPNTRTPTTSGRVTTPKHGVCCKCPPGVPFECCPCPHSQTTTPNSVKSSKTPISGHPTKYTTNTKSSSKTNVSIKSSKTRTPTTSGGVTTPKHGVCCKCPPGVPFECCPCPHSQTTTPKSVKSSKTRISGHPTKHTTNTKSSSKTNVSTKSSKTRTLTTSGRVTTPKHGVCCKCPPGVPFECCPCPHSQTTTPKSVKSSKTPHSGHPTKYTTNTKSSSKTNVSTKSSKTRTPTTSSPSTTKKTIHCCKCDPKYPFRCCPCPHSPTTTPVSVKSSKTPRSGHTTKHSKITVTPEKISTTTLNPVTKKVNCSDFHIPLACCPCLVNGTVTVNVTSTASPIVSSKRTVHKKHVLPDPSSWYTMLNEAKNPSDHEKKLLIPGGSFPLQGLRKHPSKSIDHSRGLDTISEHWIAGRDSIFRKPEPGLSDRITGSELHQIGPIPEADDPTGRFVKALRSLEG